MRRITISLMAMAAFAAAGCGGDSPFEGVGDVDTTDMEEALVDSTELPGSRPHQIDVACEEADEGESEGVFECTMDGQNPVSDEEERDNRMSYPDDRGIHLELRAWATRSDQFDSVAFAAVQVGGDPLYEGGGAFYNGGCCIESD